MNIKALIRTFTLSKSALTGVFGLTLFILVLMGVVIGLAVGINALLVWIFGEAITMYITMGIVIAYFFWMLVIDPLVSRYRRIKRQLEEDEYD